MKIICFGGGSDIAKAINKLIGRVVLIPHNECDVRYPGGIDNVIKLIEPDVIISCAGISMPGLISDQYMYDWYDQIHTNLFGSYNVIKAGGKKPIYIFIASVAGLYGKPNHSAYSVSKGGIITLVQSAAKEGYKAYSISPGRVNTKMREKDYPGEDIKTRLTTKQVAQVVKDCIKGKYHPGDNIIIRKRGYKTYKRVDKGQPWRRYLNL